MPSITQMLRSLGNAGAVANVQASLDQRRREEWLVTGLVSRLAAREALVAVGAVRSSTTAGPSTQTASTAATRAA